MSSSDHSSEQTLQELIAEIIESEKRGEVVDRALFIARYSAHADSLMDFFTMRDRIGSAADIDFSTIAPESAGSSHADRTLAFASNADDERTIALNSASFKLPV